MQQLWLFFKTYHAVILFVILEIVALGFLFSRNNYQQAKFLQGSAKIQGSFNEKKSGVYDYFSLKEENSSLAKENSKLLEKLNSLQVNNIPLNDSIATDSTVVHTDSVSVKKYQFQVAKVITNPVQSRFKLYTINKGTEDGVATRNGVISPQGVVGKVVETSEQYSLVMPLIHLQSKLNIRHQPSGYNGNLSWTGASPEQLRVENIPRNATVEVGDSIVTNQYSKSLPEGSFVGKVMEKKFDVSGNFYEIQVTPGVDFSQLNYVYVIHQLDLDEISELENMSQ